jgi:prepilin-type N-terminal cleavage/methylation domain-containing protein
MIPVCASLRGTALADEHGKAQLPFRLNAPRQILDRFKSRTRVRMEQKSLPPPHHGKRRNARAQFGSGIASHRFGYESAFTLPEMMIALAILTLVLLGVISSHLFGVKLLEITKSKLGASDQAREAISKLISEIRSAKMIKIGNGNLSTFAEIADGLPQQGSAVQIFGSTNTSTYAVYFRDSTDQKLKRAFTGSAALTTIVQSITNTTVFTSEDFSGNVLSDNQNNRVIGLILQFYQIQYPIIPVGPGNYYDYYQLRTRITRRTLE